MKRVLVIGSGGAGKSTFSRRLHKLTGLPLIHLDRVYWRAGWVEPPEEEWQKTVEELLRGDEWIIDGNFGATLDIRLAACDTTIFIDLSRAVCLYRTVKRWRMYWKTNRPDMAEGCHEKIDLEFLQWIWNYPKNKKPQIEKSLARFANEKTIIRLRSPREVENLLAKIGAENKK